MELFFTRQYFLELFFAGKYFLELFFTGKCFLELFFTDFFMEHISIGDHLAPTMLEQSF